MVPAPAPACGPQCPPQTWSRPAGQGRRPAAMGERGQPRACCFSRGQHRASSSRFPGRCPSGPALPGRAHVGGVGLFGVARLRLLHACSKGPLLFKICVYTNLRTYISVLKVLQREALGSLPQWPRPHLHQGLPVGTRRPTPPLGSGASETQTDAGIPLLEFITII